MRMPRVRFTLRVMMAAVALAALWCYIFAQAAAYRDRYLDGTGAWRISE